jgi:hypothetical protein
MSVSGRELGGQSHQTQNSPLELNPESVGNAPVCCTQSWALLCQQEPTHIDNLLRE